MKNKIIHLRISHGFESTAKDRYYCNRACSITLSKCTWDKTKVTCKNCLRGLKKPAVYCQRRTFKIVEEDLE